MAHNCMPSSEEPAIISGSRSGLATSTTRPQLAAAVGRCFGEANFEGVFCRGGEFSSANASWGIWAGAGGTVQPNVERRFSRRNKGRGPTRETGTVVWGERSPPEKAMGAEGGGSCLHAPLCT